MSVGDIENTRTHCWHKTGASDDSYPSPQYTEVCCWCGGSRIEISARVRKEGHGVFLPPEDEYTHDTVYRGGENPCWSHLTGTLNRDQRWPK